MTTTGLSAGAHTAIVTLTMSSSGTNANDTGGFMSFTGGSVSAASDTYAVGNARLKLAMAFAASASYVVTFSGNVTFTAKYKISEAGTAYFENSTIVVQVLS